MLTINGLQFAKNDSEFTDTLFNKGGTAYGYYKKLKNRVHLMDMQKKIFAAIVVTPHFQGIVNASNVDDKVFYQHAASDKVESLLGVPGRYSETSKYAETVYNRV
jgi:hypothetical protein